MKTNPFDPFNPFNPNPAPPDLSRPIYKGIKAGDDDKTKENEPQSIAEQIASSANPELEFQKYLYQVGLENIFSQYQKNIANLDSARQKDIQDAYFIREMSKKYLGEYASNTGIGDVSGNLIDIYGNYAENLAAINANYAALEAAYENKMLEESQTISQQLLGTEIQLKISGYEQTVIEAQGVISRGIQTGDYGGYDNVEDYINSLDLPEATKEDFIEWANSEIDAFESSAFVQIKGIGVNPDELKRFGLEAQPYLDLRYYTNADIMEGYAYSRNGIMYGVETTETAIPQSYLDEIDFNYRKDGNGIITYKGDIYVYMPDGTFHKMIAVEHEGAKIPKENGFLDSETTPYIETKNNVVINGVSYKKKEPSGSSHPIYLLLDLEDVGSLGLEVVDGRFRYTKEENFNGTKIMFLNGRYYSLEFKNGLLERIRELERD
jgi:Skp family chaperone for outer membrane proteins